MLGTTSEHALRALTHLAGLEPGEAILGRDLARSAGIPPNYLSKILWALGNAGFIDATRGNGGGYRLRRPARDIHLIEVVDLFDKVRAKTGCLLGGRECSDENACPAHRAWSKVKSSYMDFLQSMTIADLAHREAELHNGPRARRNA